jgi:hypothetical protein
LLRGLHGDEAHRRPLHGFDDRLGIAVIVLVALQERLHVLRRYEPYIVPELDQPTPNVMCACTDLHSDQALRNVDETLDELSSGYASAHDNLAAPILADEMKRVFADIDSDGVNVSVRLQVG